jgi:hypothetical protein
MARFATDFSEFAPGSGLPAGFSTSGDSGLYSVAVVGAAQVLRIGPHPDALLNTFFDAAGDAEDAEVYLRARWTNAGEVAGFNMPLGATLHDGDTRLRITQNGTEVRQGIAELVVNSSNASSSLNGDFHMVLRCAAGIVYAALWAADASPSRAWNFVLDAALTMAGLPGLLTGQTASTVEVLFLGVGTDGDDAPRSLAMLGVPRRPSPAVLTEDGVATLQAGTAASAYRFRVYDLPLSARYTVAGAALVLDTGWVAGGEVEWEAARTDREYGLEVTVRTAGDVESAPSFVEWFTTGEAAGRTVEGLAGFDLFGHRPEGCSDGVPALDGGGLIGGITVQGLPYGAGVLIERAGDVLHPMLPSPFGGEYPAPVVASLDGDAVLTLPADAVAVLVYSRPRRPEGNAAVQYLDVDTERDLLLRYVPEHGPQPDDVLLWSALSAAPAPEDVATSSVLDAIRFACASYAGAAQHDATRWRVWSRFGACPTLVYDSGWSADLLVHSVPLANLPAGWSTFVTATFRDERGIIGAASDPLVYRVPLALFYGTPSGGLERQAEFQTGDDEYDGTSSERRPDTISLDYLTAFCVGPEAEGDASLGLFLRAWRLRCENDEGGGTVYLARSSVLVPEAGAWDAETELFVFTGAVALEVDIAFEQAGRAVVCMERGTGVDGAPEVWLYWFDPRVPGFVLENLGAGRNPRILLDNPENPAESDVLLFYISDPNDRLEMRQQGEFYATPQATPIENVAFVHCEEVAFARDNRLHVILSVRDVASGRYALAALESAPYPVRVHEALDIQTAFLSALARREGYVVQPGGLENTSDPDLLDVSTSFLHALIVDMLIVASTVPESLDVHNDISSAMLVSLVLYPPVTMEALDIQAAFAQADSLEYILYPPLQGPESLDVQTKFASADVVAL